MMPKTEAKVPERILAYENDYFGGWDRGRWRVRGAVEPTGGDDGVEYVTAASRDAAVREALERAIMCVPGGNICDPQVVADAIRALIPGDPA